MRRRILVVLEAGTAYPSGFVRGRIYEALWREHGYDVHYVSRLYPPLVRFLDAPPRWTWPLMAAGLRSVLARLSVLVGRLRERRIVRKARRVDAVHLVKAVSFPLVSRLRETSTARLVLDLVDALWLPKYQPDRLPETLRLVDAVTTDNELTANYLRRLQPACTIVPDPPQVEAFDRRRSGTGRRTDGTLVIGWVGSTGTTYNLYVVWEALERLFAKHPHLHLRLLGADSRALPPFEAVRWSLTPCYTQTEMIDEVLQMDIGLFPLQDVEACRVRGVLKAAVYMAGGACVVASPVGQLPDLILPDRTGLLAETPAEWEAALDRLIQDPDMRRRLADGGLTAVRDRFTLDKAFEALRQVLDPPVAEKVDS